MLRLVLISLFILSAKVGFADPKIIYVWSGNAVFPNSALPSDEDNADYGTQLTRNKNFGAKVGRGEFILFQTIAFNGDSAGNGYASKQRLSFGAKLQYKIFKSAKLSFGVRYDLDYRDRQKIYYKNLILLGDYSLWKQLTPSKNGNARLFRGWANLRYPGGAEPSNKNNWVAQSQFEYSHTKKWRSEKWYVPEFAHFVGFGFGADTEGFSWNHKIKLDAGLRLKWRAGSRGVINLNVRYGFQQRVKTGKIYHGPAINLSWYIPFQRLARKSE